jgi:prepilin-type N-terminal cleavage/methylation domain-containing protein
MAKLCKNHGFSLTEVLIAVGILAVGMIFIAGVFPAAIHLTTVATERTIAAIAADEAFAKIRLFAAGDPCVPADDIQLNQLVINELRPDEFVGFDDIFPSMQYIDPNEFTYPSTGTDISQKQYCWSALCRLVEDDPNRLVQVTVFVSRRVSPNLEYPDPNNPSGSIRVSWPTPVKIGVSSVAGGRDNDLQINNTGEKTFINDGYTIVDDATGRLYRVLERYRDDPGTGPEEDAIILLDRDWEGTPANVWVIPPPVIGNPPVTCGRYPCIAVYQKVMRF